MATQAPAKTTGARGLKAVRDHENKRIRARPAAPRHPPQPPCLSKRVMLVLASQSGAMLLLLRKLLPFLFVATLAAVAYDGWFFYSRWRDSRETERAQKVNEAQEARRTIDLVGGGQLKILSFYANPGTIGRGAHAEICYGVNGAKSVRIEPPVEELSPTLARCFQVSPSQSTSYKLIAQDASGHTATQTFTLQVAP